MSLSRDIRRAARRVSWKVFSATAAAAVLSSCAVVGLTTQSAPLVLSVLLAGLTVVFLAGLTLDAIRAPFDRDLGLGGPGGSPTAIFGPAANGRGPVANSRGDGYR